MFRLKSITVSLFLAALCLIPVLLAAQQKDADKKVKVSSVRSGNTFHLSAENQNPFTITLTIEVTGKNYTLNTRQPVTKVIKPNSSTHLVSVYAKDKEKNFEFKTSYNWLMGNNRARHDDSYIYRLPFQSGKSFRIGQAYNGSFSHSGDIRYSIDFMMPEKTSIYAARGGRVVQLREDSNRGGEAEEFKNASNYLVIEHNDGTYSEYAHLSRNGVLVSLGQKVYKGQHIALSGNTGYTSGPHLHFMVIRVNKDGTHESLPVRFRDKGGIVERFEEGEAYTAY